MTSFLIYLLLFLVPAVFAVHLHFPNTSTVILSKVVVYLSNVCAREVVDRRGTVVFIKKKEERKGLQLETM
jgi:hypothetical protein